MITNQWFLYAIALGITLLIGIVALVGYLFYKKNSSKNSYEEQLKELIEEENVTKKVSLTYRWNQYWSKLFKDSGWSRYNENAENAGRDVLIAGIVLMLIISVLSRVFILGPLVVFGLGGIIVSLVKFRNQKEQRKLDEQLPGFLAALKSNIQANTTPEKALLKVVDEMPSPLYEDLYPSKQQILANTPFEEVLRELSGRTKSPDMKFLCSCILQAISSGASLESQIDTIQRVLAERQKINDEINKSVSAVTPSIWVASIAIPVLFLGLYLLNDETRAYWFVHPTSWIALIFIIILWIAGIWLSKKQVDKIRNL